MTNIAQTASEPPQGRSPQASQSTTPTDSANTAAPVLAPAVDAASELNQVPPKRKVSLLRLLEPLKAPLFRHWPLLVLTIFAGWGKFTIPLAIPWLTGKTFDLILPTTTPVPVAESNALLLTYATWTAVLIVIIGIATYFRSALASRLTAFVQHHLRKRLFFHMQRLSVSFFHRHHAGALGARVSSDINHAAVILNKGVIQWAMDGMSLCVTAAIMFSMNWMLAVIAIIFLSANGLVIRLLGPGIRLQRKEIQERQSSVTGCAAEYFAGISVVKAYAGEDASDERFDISSMGVRDAQVLNAKSQGRYQAWTSSLVLSAQVLVVFVGAFIILNYPTTLSYGDLVAFLLYVSYMNGSVQRLSDSMMELQDGVAALDRMHDIHSIMPSPPEACNPIRPELKGNIAFENVCFAYKEGEPVLNDFTYNFEAGKSYALVGPSGGGKSTITQLMLRFYDPQEGKIKIDGHSLRKIAKQHYRSKVSVVLQDPIIFSGTVVDNIGFAEPDVGMERIERAAKDAQAHDFILNLPEGYQSRLGERGVALSGGQRQRIAIARALMRDPALLILDEATSALDTITERAIQQVMDELHGTRTMIVIAHRLSTIRKVDRILVIEKGRLIEEGTYDELVARDGHFARLAVEEEKAEH